MSLAVSDWWGWLLAAIGVLAVVVQIGACVLALGVIPGNRKPSTGMAWLILILVVPYLGLLLFLLFGSTSVGRRRREWQRRVNEEVLQRVAELPAAPVTASHAHTESPVVAGLAQLGSRLGALPLTHGNTVEVLDDYQHSIDTVTAEVARAERFVHVESYIVAWDEVTSGLFEALAAAAERGVEVRLLFDHLGSRGINGYKELLARLGSTKIRWAPMLPVGLRRGQLRRPDLRNHRKLVVVDGEIGFIGSLNFIERGYGDPKKHKRGLQWVELVTRLTGPVVQELAVVFATDWTAETGEDITGTLEAPPAARAPVEDLSVPDVACQIVPSGPGFATENNLRMFNSMLYAARERVSITSPYFVPDESLLYAVTTAAQRGVEVELFVSAVADQFMVFHAQRSYYGALLEAGVRIWLYPAPYVLHSKFFTVDDSLAVVGSSNMDYRSFALNYECVVLTVGPAVVDRLRVVQDEYRSLSRELTREEWSQRGWRDGYVDNVMRLTAALQ